MEYLGVSMQFRRAFIFYCLIFFGSTSLATPPLKEVVPLINNTYGFYEGSKRYQKLFVQAIKGLGINKQVFLRVHHNEQDSAFACQPLGNQHYVILFNQQFCEKNKLTDSSILFAFGHECAHIIAPRHANHIVTEKWCDLTAAEKLNCAHGGVLYFRLMKEKYPFYISKTHPSDTERISYLSSLAKQQYKSLIMALLNVFKNKEKLSDIIWYFKKQ
jgi:hypothetical protein